MKTTTTTNLKLFSFSTISKPREAFKGKKFILYVDGIGSMQSAKKWMTRKLKPNRVIKACSLYPYIVFRVRFYEKKSKMTCVRVFFFVIFFECSQIARAGVQGLSHDAMLCDYGLFNHTSALNVLQSITSWQMGSRDAVACGGIVGSSSRSPVASEKDTSKRRRYSHFNQ